MLSLFDFVIWGGGEFVWLDFILKFLRAARLAF